MATARPDPALHLRPMVHVADLAASITFYEHLGGEIIHGGRDTGWVLMQLGTVQMVLLTRPPDTARGENAVELTFGTDLPLEKLEKRLHNAGFPIVEMITDSDFGDQLQARTPDGLLIRISQREPED